MKSIRKIISVLLMCCGIAVFSAGCADVIEETTPTAETHQTVTELTEVTEPTSGTLTIPQTEAAPTETEAPPETESPVQQQESQQAEATAEPEPTPGAAYYVKVNCEANTVTVYEKDETGAYTVPCKAMVCSSGLDETPTPTGEYQLTGNRWPWLEMVGGVWGQYVTQIYGNYLFHSVPYTEYGNHGSLQEGEFDKLGEDASHGCIRLQVADARWIYDNLWNIEGVELYNSPDPGPLGKPAAPKIAARAYPGWDPTDQVEGNPWQGES